MERSTALLLAFGALVLTLVYLSSGRVVAAEWSSAVAARSEQSAADQKARFAAQVVAVQWVGPVMWR